MNELFKDLTDIQLLTLCIYGEARGEGLDGMLAVGSVVMNRVNHPTWWGKDVHSVILKRKQFSCFNPGDANHDTIKTIAQDFDAALDSLDVLKRCHWIAKGIIEKQLPGNVGPADHYHSIKINPGWAGKMKFVRLVGNHQFYHAGREA